MKASIRIITILLVIALSISIFALHASAFEMEEHNERGATVPCSYCGNAQTTYVGYAVENVGNVDCAPGFTRYFYYKAYQCDSCGEITKIFSHGTCEPV